MIRLTLLLLASIAVVMVVAGRGPGTPPVGSSPADVDMARAERAPAELIPRPNRLNLDDEEGAVARALAAGASVQKEDPVPEVPATEIAATAIRSVRGNRVNMRSGPGTTFDVVGRLQKGDRVEILDEPGNGWVKLRDTQTGRTAWIADFLLDADG